MTKTAAFPKVEYDRRIAELRARLDARGLRGILVAAPENVFYLTGLEHMGYFAYEMLVVPLEGDLVLVTRAMEAATVADQVPWIRHAGYSDGVDPIPDPVDRSEDFVMGDVSESGESVGLRPWEMSAGIAVSGPVAGDEHIPIDKTVEAMKSVGLDSGKIAVEKKSSFLPFAIAEGIVAALPSVEWIDASDLVNDCRIVQSDAELKLTRKAAQLTDSMMLSAIAAAGPGVNERDVMAAVYDSMFRRGGTYPGFVPLIRSTRTIKHEHGTWTDGAIKSRDVLFVELAGCVRRYHAPAGRLVFIGKAPRGAERIGALCEKAMMAAAKKIGPGVTADEVYRVWQDTIDKAGLEGYQRHHCGYAVGIGFPPSWSGSGTPRGLRKGSKMKLEKGMVFHLMSWLLRTGKGDSFLSDTIVITENGCEFLTKVSRAVTLR
jgi:Xaa-Pro dipeptidase